MTKIEKVFKWIGIWLFSEIGFWCVLIILSLLIGFKIF